MLKTKTNMATTGSWGTRFGSYINRTSVYACLYEPPDYKAYNGYWSENPSSNGSWTSGGTTTIASLKFVRTERECSQAAYPRWYAETSPTVAGFGDMNRDRRADALVRDLVGRLWFLPGDGTGRMVGSGGWNAMDSFLAVGDTTGDGRPDLSTVTNSNYVIDGGSGHWGWLVGYRGLGTGGFAAGERNDGEWWGLNDAF